MTPANVSAKVFLLAALGMSAVACASSVQDDSEREIDTAPFEHEVCTYELRPVCGDDHRTYATACVAHMAGVSVLHHHACGERDCAAVDGTVVEASNVDESITCPEGRAEHGIVRTRSSEASGADAICCVPR